MASQMALLSRARIALLKTLCQPNHPFKASISTFPFLSQEPQLADPSFPPPSPTPLPPNPASGSPLYNENWRNPIPHAQPQSIIPLGFLHQSSSSQLQALSNTLDGPSLMNVFADWTASQRWADMNQLFEFWIRSLDKNGKPNKPDVNLYNHFLRAKLMIGASTGELLDLLEQMEDYVVSPNTASFNLVLKAMHQARETEAAEKLIQRLGFISSVY